MSNGFVWLVTFNSIHSVRRVLFCIPTLSGRPGGYPHHDFRNKNYKRKFCSMGNGVAVGTGVEITKGLASRSQSVL